MGKLKRVEVRDILEQVVDFDSLTLEDARKLLDSFLSRYASIYHNIYFEQNYQHDISDELQLIGNRFENDEEYGRRLADQKMFRDNKKKEKEQKEAEEYKEYLRLREKFNGSVKGNW